MAIHYNNSDGIEFSVITCPYGTSPNSQLSIWDGQHFCVSDKPEIYMDGDNEIDIILNNKLSEEKSGESIIRNQLNVEHFSVLNFAYVKFNCYGFPHSVVQQATRHRDISFLVTSMRYTGEKFIKVANRELEVDKVFYVRPEGKYFDRYGKKINWTDKDKLIRLEMCFDACEIYAKDIENGMPFEMAREFLPFCYRQPFTMACTVEALFHFLDQRTKTDSEIEIQILARLIFEEFQLISPELAQWYKEKRYGKARLAP